MSADIVSFESKILDSVRGLLQQIQKNEKEHERKEVRYSLFKTVTIHSHKEEPGLTREVSQSSVGLLHEHRIRPNEPFRMTVRYEDGYGVTIPMASVWCRPCGMGWYISGARLLDRSAIQSSNTIRFPDNLLGFFTHDIDQITQKRIYDPNLDKRCEARYQVTLPLTITPVTADLKPRGTSLTTVTRDISGSGISFFARDEVESGLLSLEMRSLNGQLLLRAIMETLRCTAIGDYRIVAGKFITKRYFVL